MRCSPLQFTRKCQVADLRFADLTKTTHGSADDDARTLCMARNPRERRARHSTRRGPCGSRSATCRASSWHPNRKAGEACVGGRR